MITRHFLIALTLSVLLLTGPSAFSQNRQSIGGAFERNYRSARPSPSPELRPEDRKRLVGEVSNEIFSDAVKAKAAGHLTEALTLFERAQVLDPDNQAARDQAAEIRRHLEASSKAQKTPVHPSSSKLLTRLWNEAEAATRSENWDEAQALYRKILAIDPDNKRARARQEHAEAKLFERLKARGAERERAGDTEGALDAYQLALVHGQDEEVLNRLDVLKSRLAESNRKKSDEIYVSALSASQQGNDEKARGLCREALKLDGTNIQAQRMLERLEKRPH